MYPWILVPGIQGFCRPGSLGPDLGPVLESSETLILDFTMTHTRYGRSIQHTTGQLTLIRSLEGAPEPDGVLQKVVWDKIRHCRQNYLHQPDPITFMPLVVDTSDRIYDDFNRLLFLHAHREASVLTNELPEEPDQFRFLRATCLTNLKGSVGLILAKQSTMRISIPFDLSSRPFIPLPCFIRSRRPISLLTPSLVLFPPCSD